MSNWGPKSRLYLLSAVMKHGTEDWNLVNDVINTHLSNAARKSGLTADMCRVEYESLVSGRVDRPASSGELSLQEVLTSELRTLRLQEIESQLAVCRQRYFGACEDKQLIETGRLKEHNEDILSEIEKRGGEFDLKNFCEEGGIRTNSETDAKSGNKNKSKARSAASKNKTPTDKEHKKTKLPMIVTIQTAQLPPSVSASPRKGDTPSLDAHSFNIGSPSCTETSREVESKSELSFPSQPRHNLSLMKLPLKDCILTQIERAAGAGGLKTWRKAILLVWREATQHKYANVFLNAVTNDEAPGYRNIVNFPLDLSSIKRNIESGRTNTTREFQRDMMLLFRNAIMYNRSDHVITTMAQEMLFDVVESIESFIDTQLKLHEQREMGADDESRLSVMKTRRARRATREEEGVALVKRTRFELQEN